MCMLVHVMLNGNVYIPYRLFGLEYIGDVIQLPSRWVSEEVGETGYVTHTAYLEIVAAQWC